jgi:ferric-dicitrate binding protein FerR (iron transport regulator)
MVDEEHVTAQILRLAGAPPDPSAQRTARVHEAVHRAWRANRRRRAIRHGAAIALLGAAATFVIAVWMSRPHGVVAPSNQAVAMSQRIQGRPIVIRKHERPAVPQPLSLSTSIHVDDVIETDGASRAAIEAADGSSVRIDRASRVAFLAPALIEVTAGAVYVATSDGSQGFEVRTPIGTLRDVGTQFEVRLTGSSLRLRVRTGTVEIRRDFDLKTATSGTEAMVTPTGIAVRQVPSFGAEWAWTTDVAPSFAIEGRPLHVFLEYIAAEEGWTLRYSAPDVAEAARRIVLHGSVDGLKAEEALGVALATSGLQYRLQGGELLVSRPATAR